MTYLFSTVWGRHGEEWHELNRSSPSVTWPVTVGNPRPSPHMVRSSRVFSLKRSTQWSDTVIIVVRDDLKTLVPTLSRAWITDTLTLLIVTVPKIPSICYLSDSKMQHNFIITVSSFPVPVSRHMWAFFCTYYDVVNWHVVVCHILYCHKHSLMLFYLPMPIHCAVMPNALLIIGAHD